MVAWNDSKVYSVDREKPDGTMRKLMDVSLASKLGWQATTEIDYGLALAYKSYLKI